MDKDKKRIKPAAISLSQSSAEKSPGRKVSSGSKPGRIITWISLSCLLMIAAGVIFVLPDMARTPGTTTTQTSLPGSLSEAANSAPVRTAKPEASPWSEAQLAKLRKETQDILAELLKQQEELEAINVEQWAKEEYTRALEAATQGDAAYRQRAFEESQEHYQRALEIFARLYEQSETYYADAMNTGAEALKIGDSESARDAFQNALLINPGDDPASGGLLRTMALDEVFAHIHDAEDQMDNDDLDGARRSLQTALELDKDTELARELLKEVNNKITTREFNKAMTRGYAALNSSQYETAKNEFSRANKIKPGSAEVISALAQANNKLTSIKISELLEAAKAHEKTEDWLSAVHAYDQALALDSSLGIAQEGRQHAQYRNNMDKRLGMAIAKPERLSNETVNRETSALLNEAHAIRPPGTKLKQQLAMLAVMLEESMTLTLVILRSNSETDVTIYRVGELGLFDRKELELRPGSYVAVGKREGYRDVRIEFNLIANKTPPPITVSCEEKIALRR